MGCKTEKDSTSKKGIFSNGKLNGFAIVNNYSQKTIVKSNFLNEKPTDFIEITNGNFTYVGEYNDG